MAHLVGVVVHRETLDLLAVVRPVDVHGHVVAVDGRSGRGGQVAELLAELVHLLADLLVGGLGAGHLGLELVVAGDGDERADLHHRVEADRPFLGTAGDVDLWRCDHVYVVVVHCLGVVLGHRAAEGLSPSRLGTQPRLQHSAGGFAGAESGQAHLAGELTEGLVQLLLELLRVDVHRQLDPVALQGLDCAPHRLGSLPAALPILVS